ncbi:hypothetical protein [Salinisphaera hydrothermalis]|uniref:hypothetical protein n=1 Tax=Salinisphaera hydrothermalis TaxID=563188 RepID=UPI003341128E
MSQLRCGIQEGSREPDSKIFHTSHATLYHHDLFFAYITGHIQEKHIAGTLASKISRAQAEIGGDVRN